mgnify:CR=1 FL=1
MNLARTFTSAIITAALLGAAVPAAAQARQRSQERARQNNSQNENRERARAQSRSENRERARQAPAPRGSDSRRYEGRSNQGERRAAPRAVPRSDDRSSRGDDRSYRGDDRYRGDNRSSGGNDRYRGDNRSYGGSDRRGYVGPRAVPRPRYSRPYYYSRPYVRPYRYVPYRPFSFSQRYYSFRPHLHLGFGLWIGSPVPYPYRYLGSYRPRIYGAPYGYSTGSVSIYGGVSFDIQPSDADLFINGEYVGQVGDFNPYSEPLTLTPGVHRIAVQRDGFRPMEWEIEVQPGQVIPYRGEMERY